jgi:hypothetical protein
VQVVEVGSSRQEWRAATVVEVAARLPGREVALS